MGSGISAGILLFQKAGYKHFPPPVNYDDIDIPERPKLPFLPKTPIYPAGVRAPKMMKAIHLIRGEEEVHKDLILQQYGIIALRGGYLRWGHLEMIRLGLIRKLDLKRMFAIWRIDAPWKAVTKKGI